MKYYHAPDRANSCYTTKRYTKDYTKLYGFQYLDAEDKKKFLNEEQLRYEAELEAAKDRNRKLRAEQEAADRSATNPICDKDNFTVYVTGLKYAPGKARTGDALKLVRDPNNQYDSNAIQVQRADTGIKVGNVGKEQAALLSPRMLKDEQKQDEIVYEANVIDQGDGYKQLIHIFVKNASASEGSISEEAVVGSEEVCEDMKASSSPRGSDVNLSSPITVGQKRKSMSGGGEMEGDIVAPSAPPLGLISPKFKAPTSNPYKKSKQVTPEQKGAIS